VILSIHYDLVVRGGTVVDGSGGVPFVADVAVLGKDIVAVGDIKGRARDEIDARGRLVTPGFVDIHTHYDGQVTWEQTLSPSSQHGVTTVLTGNCGVGFAPVRKGDEDMLIRVMEGVEDIPEIVMRTGIPWNWESFPQYLDALERRTFDIDVATQVPHSPIRVYVMGQRGADHEPSTPQDRAAMTQIVTEAIRAGALGVSTSRSLGHRLKNGELAPSVTSAEDELLALAEGLRRAGSGVFQLIPEVGEPPENEISLVCRLARTAQRPISFTLLQAPRQPDGWRTLLGGIEQANAHGLQVRGQVFPRPVGVLLGLDLSLHPFMTRPSYKTVASLPLSKRVAIMRDPDFKRRILAEEAMPDPQPMNNMLIAQTALMSVLADPVDYAPDPSQQLGSLAQQAGRALDEYVYDVLLEDDGRTILYLPGANFVNSSLAAAREMMIHPNTIIGLGDGGAHYGFICDASFTTYTLTYWTRDVAPEQRMPLEWAVAELSRRPAQAVGLDDRGLIAAGMKADINVIDYERLKLFAPRIVHDLPAGGRRLQQRAQGYDATIVSGAITYREGFATGALPGRLVRGRGHVANA
jgi:N-acyl-D-amino-acid deacylase